jgi:hypothetical protein
MLNFTKNLYAGFLPKKLKKTLFDDYLDAQKNKSLVDLFDQLLWKIP